MQLKINKHDLKLHFKWKELKKALRFFVFSKCAYVLTVWLYLYIN